MADRPAQLPHGMALLARFNLLVDQIAEDAIELNRRQSAVLLYLGLNEGPQLFRDVAAAVGVHKPVLHRILRALRGHGFVLTRRGGEDGRDLFVTIEPAGRAWLGALR